SRNRRVCAAPADRRVTFQDMCVRETEPVSETDSGRGEASIVRHRWSPFTIGSEAQAREDVLVGQFGKVGEDFFLRHTRGEIRQDVVYRDSHASHAWLTAAFARFNRDDVLIAHTQQKV